jgi:hypothetical protein
VVRRLMRTTRSSLRIGVCVLSLVVLGACHANKTVTQKFVREDDSSQFLTLSSQRGLIDPSRGFPSNFFFKVFGGGELEGTYEQKSGESTVKGKFLAGKDGETQWIKFTPSEGSEANKEWKVKVKLGGMLVDEAEKVWDLKTTKADTNFESAFKIGG